MHKPIKVVGGLIFDNNKLLIAQRNSKKEHPLKWEFPGGKVLPNEQTEQALVREISEELSIKINNPEFLLDYTFSYTQTKTVHLFFFKIMNSY